MKINFKYILIIILNCFSVASMAQSVTKNIELSDLFINNQKVIEFIKLNLTDLKPLNNIERVFHPLVYHKFNKTLKDSNKKFSFFGKPIDLIYAYYDVSERDKFALYILLDIKKDDLKTFSKIWGHPGNVSFDDFTSGEFSSQMWNKDGTDVIIGRSFADDYGPNSQIVQISNIKLQKLYGIE